MNKSIPLLAVAIGCLVAGSVAGPAMARMGGSFGSGGHMSGSMSSGTTSFGSMPPSATQALSAQSFAPMTSFGARDSNTGSNSSNVFRSLDSPIPGIANSPGP
jgi:hypothetical protein